MHPASLHRSPRFDAPRRPQRELARMLARLANYSSMDSSLEQGLAAVGPRLRAPPQRREVTLADLSAATGISVSTLSRLESGQRRPNLELLLPLARAHRVPLDELVGAPASG